ENWTYYYDHENRMTKAEHRASTGTSVDLSATYKYDVYGNRIEKSADADGVGAGAAVVTKYAYDGWNSAKPRPIGNENWDVWADLTSAGAVSARYTRGDIVDQVFARMDASGNAYWLLTDRMGSVRDVIDSTGTVKNHINYDGFGNIVSETDASFRGRYAWTGRELDAETGLQYNRARYYDPKTGRWTSQDPLGFDAGDANLYRYVKNQSVSFADPSGLDRYFVMDFPGHAFLLVDNWSFIDGRWRKNGYWRYDFSAFLPDKGFFANAWNAALASTVSATGVITESYLTSTDEVGEKMFSQKNTPAQDRELIREIRAEVNAPARYHGLFFNCHTWAQHRMWFGGITPSDDTLRSMAKTQGEWEHRQANRIAQEKAEFQKENPAPKRIGQQQINNANQIDRTIKGAVREEPAMKKTVDDQRQRHEQQQRWVEDAFKRWDHEAAEADRLNRKRQQDLHELERWIDEFERRTKK
ncbi:MAG: RHS repeat-associated core domain-containing protein, partial [Gemmataceae bacterium]|nr:RHS repeat-associated core domain-containing protein [Gemmataceae bacterium]